jgi:polyisoprenoid-binding protein YceI
MKSVFLFFFLLIACMGRTQELIPVDDESSITFSIKNFGLSVEGTFRGLKGKIRFDPEHADECSFAVSIDAATIDTGIDLRNKHLKKEEYLHVSLYPLIQFESTAITKKNTGWIVRGNLTIKNKTMQIEFPFAAKEKDSWLFSGQFKINRKDFDVGGRNWSMSDSLTVNLKVATIRLNTNKQ